RLWDVARREQIGQPLRHASLILSLAFSPDGRYLLSASSDYTARLWDAATGAPVGPPLQHPGAVRHARYSSDGQNILTVCTDTAARLWELPARPQARTPLPHRDAVHAVAFSPDGKIAVSGDGVFAVSRGEARLWDVESGKPIGAPLRYRNVV